MNETSNNDILGRSITSALAEGVIPTTPSPDVVSRIKSKLMGRVREAQNNFTFIFSQEGHWDELAPGVRKKILHIEDQRETFLLKMNANSCFPSHSHETNEEAFVVYGDVILGGIECHEGDYHYAKTGSMHSDVITKNGCLLYIRLSR